MTKNGQHDLFATTRWTMVIHAGGPVGETAATALEELCRIYWYPLYAYIRRHGYNKEDAEDLTQGFFAHLLDKHAFSALNANQGKFRAFLLACLKNYLANEYDRSRSAKRGGNVIHLSLDWEYKAASYDIRDNSAKTPDQEFDREWALALLRQVLIRLRQEWADKEKTAFFDAVKDLLAIEGSDTNYGELAATLGMDAGHLRVSVHRMRKRYRELLKHEIAHTLSDPQLVDEEMATLAAVLC